MLEVYRQLDTVPASMSKDNLESKTIKQELLTKCEGIPLRKDLIQFRDHEGPVRSIQTEMERLSKSPGGKEGERVLEP